MAKTQPQVFLTAFDEYVVHRQVGEGGAGRVFEVASSSGERLALKLLAPERITADRQKRFRNEISFCQRGIDPGIVKVRDFGFVAQGKVRVPFYVMPMYALTMRQVMQVGVSPVRAISILTSLARTLSAAHQHGVWHRDIKPENILFSDADSAPIVADFGIAHFEEESLFTAVETRDISRLANFLYSSPEQRERGGTVDHKADIFALGLIGFELFTGKVPQGAGFERIASKHPEYAQLDDLLEELIQHSPANRPASLLQVEARLTEFVRHELVVESPALGEAEPEDIILSEAIALRRTLDFESYKKQVLSSEKGVDEASRGTQEVIDNLQKRLEKANEHLKLPLRIEKPGGVFEARLGQLSLTVMWRVFYSNTLDGAELKLTVWHGDAPLQGRIFFEQPEKLVEEVLVPVVDLDRTLRWAKKGRPDNVLATGDVSQLAASRLFSSLATLAKI